MKKEVNRQWTQVIVKAQSPEVATPRKQPRLTPPKPVGAFRLSAVVRAFRGVCRTPHIALCFSLYYIEGRTMKNAGRNGKDYR